jgi:predicted MPP superfamily phosphohydrolase
VAVVVALTAVAVAAFAGLPLLMAAGHGRRHLDAAARVGDTTLGVAWVLFTWTVLGQLVELVLAFAGMPDPLRSRVVAAGVLVVTLGLLAHGTAEALRLPRVRRRDVVLDRLGPGLDGLRVVVLADTHFGPLDRTRWSQRVARVVAGLEPDVLVHAGDLADGDVADRAHQVRPVAELTAPLGRFSIVGNHEHFSGAAQWVQHLRGLGWQPLVNAHGVVERGGDRLVVAGVDDPTGTPDLRAALSGVAPDLPVLLLAHQPSQVRAAIAAGVDLQISGHTHGGQIWPFHLLVRLDQKQISGLRRHGERTQLYVSRGTGFWGPPLRIFAPSEITVLTLRTPG